MTEWKAEYAESIKHYVGPWKDIRVFHHVHPDMPGRAHCVYSVDLDTEKVVNAVPSDHKYCERCRLLFLSWQRTADVARS